MTAPVDTAFQALAAALAAALVEGGFIAQAEDMEINPSSLCEPSGDETEVQTVAQLFRLQIKPVRPLMGGASRRWVVELMARLEMAVFGPIPDGEDDHDTRLTAMLDAVAPVTGADPTLGQTCERAALLNADDDDLPPNGLKKTIDFVIRLRAGDELGRTAP